MSSKNYYIEYDLVSFPMIKDLGERIDRFRIDRDLLDAAIFWRTNKERQRYSLSQFSYDSRLQCMARLHSEQMRNYKFFDHENKFDFRYRTLRDRAAWAIVDKEDRLCGFAENIINYPAFESNEPYYVRDENGKTCFYKVSGESLNYSTYWSFANILVVGWMNSEGHRKNILNPTFKHLGCGCAAYAEIKDTHSVLRVLATQNFRT